MPIAALGNAVMTMSAQNIGANKLDRVKGTFKKRNHYRAYNFFYYDYIFNNKSVSSYKNVHKRYGRFLNMQKAIFIL